MTMPPPGQQGPLPPPPTFKPGQAGAALYAMDPKLADAADQDAAILIWEDIWTQVEAISAALFQQNVPPAQRLIAYNHKTRAVIDPATGIPQNLWMEQKLTFPDDYEADVKDAYHLGAELASWAEEDAVAYGAKPPEEE
jgi:hypothetical protein